MSRKIFTFELKIDTDTTISDEFTENLEIMSVDAAKAAVEKCVSTVLEENQLPSDGLTLLKVEEIIHDR